MPPEPSQVPVGSSPDLTARQRLHMHGIKEMPAGYDAEVAELFRDLRSASGISEAELAARLATRVEVVQALEQGALYALPPWAETCRVVNGYGAMLNLDVRPLLRRIYAQIESGIVELGPKPIPDVPVMAAPEPVDFGFEPDKRTVRPVANFQAPDWPDNPFAAPPAKPAQPSSPPPQQAQRPQHAKPQAAAPQQNAWPQPPAGSPSPFQANWPNAAPSAPPAQPPQQPRPNSNAAPQQAKPQPQASWPNGGPQRQTAAPQQQQPPQVPRQQQPRPPQQAKAPSSPPPQPKPQPVADADFDGAWQQQPSRPMGQPPGEAELEAARQQPNRPKPQPRSRPQAATPPPPPPPLPMEEPETPSRKKALLKWGLVTLLIAIMAVGGWMVLGSVRGSGGLQSSKPGVLDPDDPRSRKADRLQGPS